MPSKVVSELVDFDIDRYLNPFVPHNRVSRLPTPIARFLGHRNGSFTEPPALVQWFSAFFGSFIGILLVGAIFKYAPGITNHNPPVIVGSLGASAILDYSAIRTPLAQPRNSVLGQGLSAIVGVAIAKAFQLNSNFEDLQWVAGAVACACAALVMCVTNTVHPPGGATAVIATTQPIVITMGWWYVPVTTLGAVVMLVVACLWNNILRQFPVYWWTPSDVGSKLRDARSADEKDEEKGGRKDSDTSSQNTLRQESTNASTVAPQASQDHISISADAIHVPGHVRLSHDERAVLLQFQERLHKL